MVSTDLNSVINNKVLFFFYDTETLSYCARIERYEICIDTDFSSYTFNVYGSVSDYPCLVDGFCPGSYDIHSCHYGTDVINKPCPFEREYDCISSSVTIECGGYSSFDEIVPLIKTVLVSGKDPRGTWLCFPFLLSEKLTILSWLLSCVN